MSQIVPMILSRMKEELERVLVTEARLDDPLRGALIKLGRFQDDPVNLNLYAAISSGDPEDPQYVDGVVTLQDMDRIGQRFPVREIGGGQLWWRRGLIQVGCYFINEQLAEEVAIERAYAFLGRVMAEVERVHVSDLIDDHGERAYKLYCYGNTFFQSGGPPASYLYRGKVLWSCLTSRP